MHFLPNEGRVEELKQSQLEFFRESLDMVVWPVIEDGSSLNDLANKFVKLLEGALEKACPEKKTASNKGNSWWDHKLEESLQKVRDRRDWKDRNQFDEIDYKVAKKEHLHFENQKEG